MFSVEERDRVRRLLLDLAAGDAAVAGAAITGSHAVGGGDRWSDVDLAFGVTGPLEPTMRRWTDRVYQDFAAVHHWDVRAGSAVYRVFLLGTGLEVDLAFLPATQFGPHGPRWRTVFGEPAPQPAAAAPSRQQLTGLAWHHVLHARASIHRHHWWQAEQWISAVRGQVLALACRRLDHRTDYAKDAHLLPAEVTGPLTAALVRGLDPEELVRALSAATGALLAEIARGDAALADRLAPLLTPATPDGGPS